MLSLARREDARKGVGLEVFKRGGEMEENELEEGEACSSKEDDATIDPDITLSYIDEKIRDVLGHFQKDFEGGVSSENLGRKICDYGSFLPANRCLVSIPSQSGSLQKLPNHNTSRPPYSTSAEAVQQNMIFHTNTSVPLKKASVSNASPLDARKKNEGRVSIPNFRECVRQHDVANADSKSTHQKTLKVRIKVGSDTAVAKPNAAIYSVMGLEYSPSSSPDSPGTSGGSHLGRQSVLHESPTAVCQIMTRFPVPAESVLSPLSESFLQLIESAVDISKQSSSSRVTNETSGRPLFSEESKGDGSLRESENVISKVRVLSSGIAKDEALVGGVSLGSRKMRNSGNESLHLKGKQNSKMSLSDQVSEGRAGQHKDASCDSPMENISKREKKCNVSKFEADGLNFRMDANVKSDELTEEEGHQGTTLHGQHSEKPLKSKNQSPGARRKSGNQMNVVQSVESSPNNFKNVSSVPSNEKKKSSHSKMDPSEYRKNSLGRPESSKAHSQQCQNDAADDAKSEKTVNITDPSENLFRDKGRDNRIDHDKVSSAFSDRAKEKVDVKNDQNPSTSEAFENGMKITPLATNGPTSHATPAPAALLVKEDWVCCDICQKWRLLPYGTNTDHLPSNWLCTMQDWLPGMNKCSFSEEETTRALHALYQAPLPETHTANGLSTLSGALSCDTQHGDQNHGLLNPSSHGKKKLTLKAGSHTPGHLTQPSSSVKKSRQISIKSRSLNDVNHVAPHSSGKSSSQHMNKSTELNVETDYDNKKAQKMMEQYLDSGEFLEQNGRPSKSKSNRGFDQDGSRVSKKLKAEGTLYANDCWDSEHDISERLASIGNDNLPSKMTGYGSLKDDDSSSCKNFKLDSENRPPGSRKKSKQHPMAFSNGSRPEQFSSFDKENSNNESSAKKRKSKERQEDCVNLDTLVGNGLLAGDSVNAKETYSESDSKKGKKSRLLNAEGIYSDRIEQNGKVAERGQLTRVVLSKTKGQVFNGTGEVNKCTEQNERKGLYKSHASSKRSLDCVDSRKKDLSYGHPSTAAVSSSSKVSGSCKSKSNIHEARDSPVESVSSSPLRTSNDDELVNEDNMIGKEKDKSYAVDIRGSLDAYQPLDSAFWDPAELIHDYQGREGGRLSKTKDEIQLRAFGNMPDDPSLTEYESVTGALNNQGKNRDCDEVKPNNHNYSSSSDQRKSIKCSSRSREKHRISRSEVNINTGENSNSFPDQDGIHSGKDGHWSSYDGGIDSHKDAPYHKGVKDACSKLEKDEKKRESRGSQSSEGRREDQLNFGTQENLKKSRYVRSRQQGDLSKTCDVGTVSTKIGKSYIEHNPQILREPLVQGPLAAPSDVKGDKLELSLSEATTCEAEKVHKQLLKHDCRHGQHSNFRHPTPNRLDGPSPIRRDSNHSAAAALLKEARGLKHTADRLKNEGLENESTGLYFEAALKFLHVAFLRETSCADGETTQSMEIYSSTAKLCEFCAHLYEKHKEMAAAALAYKCMEVANMKVVFSKDSGASKDRNELHTALQLVPTGESPSSSASDVDNLNNQNMGDKAVSAKAVSSPHGTGNHVIAPRNRPNFVRLLNFVQDVNDAMEASRKSHSAFHGINGRPEESRYEPEVVASVRQVLALSFHDVEGLLRLVRLSMDSITR
ncbi:unnamed protein product [Spirodela intermedia]|uniref:CW-type domain-containing protein n=1 Tax=Spirodela intermedia TaxID=51605 RepID=A0A7I8JXG8_SPIIN|nr:unnamed protein product [Spirodela intermedia]